MNAVQNAAIHYKVPALVFSLEMSAEALGERLLCLQARVGFHQAARRILGDARLGADHQGGAPRIAEAPMYIDDSGAPTLLEIRAKSRRWRADPRLFNSPDQLGLIVIDYLQLIQGRVSKEDNRQREISEISRGLKALAKELRVPRGGAVAAQPLAGVARLDKRPMLSDLRESGAIEQDADLIAFIYRDEVYSHGSVQRRTKASPR